MLVRVRSDETVCDSSPGPCTAHATIPVVAMRDPVVGAIALPAALGARNTTETRPFHDSIGDDPRNSATPVSTRHTAVTMRCRQAERAGTRMSSWSPSPSSVGQQTSHDLRSRQSQPFRPPRTSARMSYSGRGGCCRGYSRDETFSLELSRSLLTEKSRKSSGSITHHVNRADQELGNQRYLSELVGGLRRRWWAVVIGLLGTAAITYVASPWYRPNSRHTHPSSSSRLPRRSGRRGIRTLDWAAWSQERTCSQPR